MERVEEQALLVIFTVVEKVLRVHRVSRISRVLRVMQRVIHSVYLIMIRAFTLATV